MSPSKLFEKLGAPQANVRWSMGPVHLTGPVVLKVWQDHTKKSEGEYHVQLIRNGGYST